MSFKAEIYEMLQALAQGDLTSCSTWFDDNFGFGKQSLRSVPNYSKEPAKLHDNEKRFAIIADAFLTNREDLIQILNIPDFRCRDISDSQLIVKSYEKWGEDCTKYLIGNFAFAIWDKQKRQLFCSRDHMGRCLFFYFKDSKRFIFSSKPKGILGINYIEKKLNRRKLTDLMFPLPSDLFMHESWYENIFPLAAGTNLVMDSNGIRFNKYWEPHVEQVSTYKTEQEILEEFQELMFKVVGNYLRSDHPVTALLSGGLDSSGIVSVAAKILEKQNKQLDVFSSVLPDENDSLLTDERRYIDLFNDFPNVNINYITAENKGPFSDLKELFEDRDSPSVTSRHYLYTTFAEKAHAINSRTILEGQGGEHGPTNHGAGGYAELFLKLKWFTLWNELKLRQKLYGDSVLQNIRTKIISPLVPDLIFRLRHKQISNGTTPEKPHFFQKDFAQDLIEKHFDESKSLQGNISRIVPNQVTNQLNGLLWVQKRASYHTERTFLKYPVELKYPFLDKRILEFCLTVPLSLKIRDGYDRYLIRKGLDKILPPQIQWRTTKNPFSPDYMRRFNRQRKEVERLFLEIKMNDPIRNVINVKQLQEWLKQDVKDDEKHSSAATVSLHFLPKAVYLIHFLRKFPEFRL